MTNAPADLLGFRVGVQQRTGLTAVEVGIVGDSAHAATGGYHEGLTDLTRAGVINTDYSVRLPRDKAGLTESASAFDIGYRWPRGGNAAWLRFNNLFAADLRANHPALAAVRAINYSPDGTRKVRIDRENGWREQSTTDVVDIHTHGEMYRDTEGKRQAALDRLLQLIDAAIANTTPPGGDMAGEYSPDTARAIAVGATQFGYVQFTDPKWDDEVATYNLKAVEARLGAKVDAAAAANATRDAANLAAIKALAVATGNDPQPIIDAVNAAHDDARTQFTTLLAKVADLETALAASLAREAQAAQALADALKA